MIHSLSLSFSFLLLSCSLSHSLSRCPILVSVTHTPALSHTICLFLSLTHSKMDSVWKNDFTCVLSGEKPSLRFFYAVRYHQPEMFTACQKIFSHQVLRFIFPPSFLNLICLTVIHLAIFYISQKAVTMLPTVLPTG